MRSSTSSYFSENEWFFPPGYERLYGRFVPRWGYSAGLNKHIIRQPDSIILHSPYAQTQLSEKWYTCIAIDCDAAVDPGVIRAACLPEPAAYIGRPTQSTILGSSYRPHLRINLEIPVRRPTPDMSAEEFEKAARQEWRYNRVVDTLVERYTAAGVSIDAINPPITKNPLSEEWEVTEGDVRTWTLSDLEAALGICSKSAPPPKKDSAPRRKTWRKPSTDTADKYFRPDYADRGRNCLLFEAIRGPAYMQKALCSSFREFFQWVLDFTEQFARTNIAVNPLRYAAIKSTARSVAKWTWRFFDSSGDVDRGACHRAGLITDDMAKKTKQAVGGRYGAKKKAENKAAEIFELRDAWLAEGREISISGLAKVLGMCRKTVRKHLLGIPEPADAPKAPRPIEVASGGGENSAYQEVVLPGGPGVGGQDEPAGVPDYVARVLGDDIHLWSDPGNAAAYRNVKGAVIPREYLDPYIIWSSVDPPGG